MTRRLNYLFLISLCALAAACEAATLIPTTPTLTLQPPTLLPSPTPPPTSPSASLPASAELEAYLSIGAINRMALSPDGELMALATASGLRMYDFDTFSPAWADTTVKLPSAAHLLSWSPDSQHIAVHPDFGFAVWDALTGARVWDMPELGSGTPGLTGVWQLAWLNEQHILVYVVDSEANTGEISVWDFTTREQVYNINVVAEDEIEPGQVIVSPDGRRFVIRAYLYVATEYDWVPYPVLRFFNAANGEFLYTVQADEPGLGSFNTVTFNTDSTLFTTDVWNEAEYRVELQIRDTAAGSLLHRLTGEQYDGGDRVSWSPDNRWLVMGGQGAPLIWSLEAGRRITALAGHDDYDYNYIFAWSPDSTRLATGATSDKIILWDTAMWEPVSTLTGHHGEIREMAFSADGSTLLSRSSNGQVIAWNAATGEALREIRGTERAFSAAFSPDGSRLAATVAERGEMLLWNMETLTVEHSLDPFYDPTWALRFNADGSRLAALNPVGELVIFDPATGVEVARKGSSAQQIASIDWSPDGSVLAVGGGRGSVELLDAQTGERTGGFAPPDESGFQRFFGAGVAFSPDGTQIAVSTTGEGDVISGVIFVRDAASGKVLHLWTDRESGSVHWSGDGRYLLVRGYSESVVWDVATGEEIRRFRLEDSSGNWALWSPRGALLAAGRTVDSLIIWNPDTGEEVTLQSRSGLSWSPDGQLAVTADGNVVTIYDTQSWEALLNFTAPGNGDYLSVTLFSPDGQRLIVGDWNGVITLWRLMP